MSMATRATRSPAAVGVAVEGLDELSIGVEIGVADDAPVGAPVDSHGVPVAGRAIAPGEAAAVARRLARLVEEDERKETVPGVVETALHRHAERLHDVSVDVEAVDLAQVIVVVVDVAAQRHAQVAGGQPPGVEVARLAGAAGVVDRDALEVEAGVVALDRLAARPPAGFLDQIA